MEQLELAGQYSGGNGERMELMRGGNNRGDISAYRIE